MKTLDNLKYTTTHEWVRTESDGTLAVGITDFAQDALGDIVFVEFPKVGTQGQGRRSGRRRRVGEGRLRHLRAGVGRGRRGQRRDPRPLGTDQPGRVRDVALQAAAVERRRAAAKLLDATAYAASAGESK